MKTGKGGCFVFWADTKQNKSRNAKLRACGPNKGKDKSPETDSNENEICGYLIENSKYSS